MDLVESFIPFITQFLRIFKLFFVREVDGKGVRTEQFWYEKWVEKGLDQHRFGTNHLKSFEFGIAVNLVRFSC